MSHDKHLTSDVTLCPSVFGAYPKLRDGQGAVRFSLQGGLVHCAIHDARWDNGSFLIRAFFSNNAEQALVSLEGGASTPRALSHSLLSQCLGVCRSNDLKGGLVAVGMADFLFDQLVPVSMRGLFRQQTGVGITPWLSVSDVQERYFAHEDEALFLGSLLLHPAAHLAVEWGSLSPLGGVDMRVTPALASLLKRAEPHLRSGGSLVVGPTSIGPSCLKGDDLKLPAHGWVMTGRRGGVEACARELAKAQQRPLVVATKQADVESILNPSLYSRVVVSRSSKSLGVFRGKMLDRLTSGVFTPKLVSV